VIRRGMIHFRRPAVRNHPAVCFLPVGQRRRFLGIAANELEVVLRK
jgi:hypothetical protein